MDKILILEEQKEELENLKNLVRMHEFEPITASSGKEGLDQYLVDNNINARMILVPYKLPDMTGAQFAEKIRCYSTNVPIIGVTSQKFAHVTDCISRIELYMGGLQKCINKYIKKS